MIIVSNNLIPFKGFTAITLWPFIFIRRDKEQYYTNTVDCHEHIHGEQQKEMLIIFFYLWYIIEWFIKLCYYHNSITAYKNTSFEREAYANDGDFNYPTQRKHYSWIKIIYS